MEGYTAVKIENTKAKAKHYYQVNKEKIQKILQEYYRNLPDKEKNFKN